jgi:vesicle transport through interaction with t-SNAREs 1
LETENIGADILRDLKGQREQLENTKAQLNEADGYMNKSIKTLKDMGKWYLHQMKLLTLGGDFKF